MTRLYEIREILIAIYRKYEGYLKPTGKFIMSLIMAINLNRHFAYSNKLNNILLMIVIAILGAFVPGNWLIIILGITVLGQLFAVSIEITVIVLALMIIFYLLFIPVLQDYAWVVLATVLLASFKGLYIVPIILGLFFTPVTVFPMALGIGIYLLGLKIPELVSVGELNFDLAQAPDQILSIFNELMNLLLSAKLELLIVGLSLVLVIVYFISKLDYNYSGYIAIGTGAASNIIILTIGKILLKADISVWGIIIGSLFAAIIGIIAHFMRFSLDYQRSERLQFEDDDYYYYVKAIPKVKLGKIQKEVKRIE